MGKKGPPQTFQTTSYFESYILDIVLRALFATEIDSIYNSSNPVVFNPKKTFSQNLKIEQFLALILLSISKIFNFHLLKKATDFVENLIL